MFTTYLLQMVLLLLWISGGTYSKPAQEVVTEVTEQITVIEACVTGDWIDCRDELARNINENSTAFEQLHREEIFSDFPWTEASDERTEFVEELLFNGLPINKRVGPFNMTMLHFAAKYGLINAVQFLLNHSVDVNVKDRDGDTSLHKAVRNGHMNVIKLLIENGADCNSTNWLGNTPLHIAVYNENVPIVEFLIKQHCNSSIVNIWGSTPLKISEFSENTAIIKLLSA